MSCYIKSMNSPTTNEVITTKQHIHVPICIYTYAHTYTGVKIIVIGATHQPAVFDWVKVK